MTEWDAAGYSRVAALQAAMADEVLALLRVRGDERVLDLGCGSGRVTAEIAARLGSGGSILGVDSSAEMVAFAEKMFPSSTRANLRFHQADVRDLDFREEFDLIVSFNALHWIPDQEHALRRIGAAMRQHATAQLRLVPKGKRKSLEDVIEETRQSPRWARYFEGFHDPYLHLTADEYAALAERSGLRVLRLHTEDKAWDFTSRAEFLAFAKVTFIAWTQFILENERPDFCIDVLDRYRVVAAEGPGEENFFRFYQMDITLVRK
jgi:trans-aconitate 2-methyltransferase